MKFTQNKNLGHYCLTSDTVVLHALDTMFTGGCLYTPGFIIMINLDTKSSSEDNLTVYENGKKIGYFPASIWAPLPLKLLSNECSTSAVYSFKFCDRGKDGSFPYWVYDRNHMKLISSGTIKGSDSCTTIVFPKLAGTARFSGAGVTNYNNGFGKFDPKAAGPGIHKIQYYWNDGYGFSDSIFQTDTVNPNPNITVNPVSVCKDSFKLMNANAKGARKYAWNTGANTQSILVPAIDSSYNVTVTDSNGCYASQTGLVGVLPSPSNFLKHDTSICNLISINLSPANSFISYLWSNGSSTRTINVRTQGSYKLRVTDDNNCGGVDSISVLNECPPQIYVPTAFSPGELVINNMFYAVGLNITKFQMDIFNKWGTWVFHSDNIDSQWNGSYNGKICPMGVYLYIIHYEGIVNGFTKSSVQKGTITLLR